MPIQPDNKEPGLWIDPQWRRGRPGTFAVVIGVTQYDHLDDGTDPAEDTFELGQLAVSSLTAHKFFTWLRHTYLFKDSPLVWCRLLLAPSSEELRAEPTMKDHFVRATFENAKTAILDWYDVMSRQGAAAVKSRGFFFFSGHGIEVHADKQVLLLSDFPPRGVLNDTVSTNNLLRGLLCQEVPTQFLFIDACRNDHERLLEKEIHGADILNTGRSRRNRAAIVPLFRATASGFESWQPKDVRSGPSVFGTALLEGLQSGQAFPADCADGVCTVGLYPLQTFVNRRVKEILRTHKAVVESPVRIGGESSDAVVTESRNGERVSGGPLEIAPTPEPEGPSEPVSIVTTLAPWHPSEGLAGKVAATSDNPVLSSHDLFGSERMEELWASAAVFDVKGGAWRHGSDAFKIHEVARDATRLYRVTISIPREGAQILQLNQPWFEREGLPPRRFACLLPGGSAAGYPRQDIQYRLSIVFEYGSTEDAAPSELLAAHRRLLPRSISRIEADLAPGNDGLLGMAARLWDRYREANVSDALTSRDMDTAVSLIQDKVDSPLAATVAALLMLRGRREDSLLTRRDTALPEYWLRNLANWFPDLPDGAVLWTENLQRLGPEAPAGEGVREWLREVSRRAIPYTSESLGYLATLLDEMGDLKEDVELSALRARVAQALRSFRSGGLFGVFANVDDMSFFAPDGVEAPAVAGAMGIS